MPTIPSRPSGTVTFLFTDVERAAGAKDNEQAPGATRGWREILQEAIEANGGYLYKKAGDAWQSAFSTAAGAVGAALDAQRALNSEERSGGGTSVKMSLHTGVTEERGDDYVGPLLNRAARLLAAGNGGQVLLTRAAATLAEESLPRGVTLRDLGEHRLKDLLVPEHVYQLVALEAGIPSEFPPLKTLEARPNNLPLQPTPFLGRERVVADVVEMLHRDDVALLTLTGPGGIGKTRLALQVAADIVDEFEDGVFFVPLAAINDPALVAPSIAQAIGVREESGQVLLDTLKDYFESRHLLLVLDNFEQLLDAGIQVSELLSSAARLKVLTTSRASLHLSMEYEYQVPPLRVPEPKAVPTSSVESLTQYESVELFIRRAQAANPAFAVNNQNAPAVAEICYRLEGIPLAIELAAARTKLLVPTALLAKLDSRLRLLTGGAREAHSRQQTLRNTIDWSYDLLTEGEKQLFHRAAVFRGGWTFDAAESVCNAGGDTSPGKVPPLEIDLLDGITSLVDKSLVYVAGGDGGEPRYRMLETINEYASEKQTESGESVALQRGHALYFMRLAEEAEPELTGARQGEWLDRLQEDQDNIRAVLKWAASESADGEHVEVGLRILGAIWRFWVVRGYLSGVREQMEALLRLDAEVRGADSPSRNRARALMGLGALMFTHGEPDAARLLLGESLAINRQVGDKAGMAGALNLLGSLTYEQGDYEGARALHQESLALKREIGDKRA